MVLSGFFSLCQDLGVPTSKEKTTFPSQCLPFLGIELDMLAFKARLPMDKITDLITSIETILNARKVKKSTLESLVGKLNFATSVLLGRTFTRQLYDVLATVKNPFHKIRITKAIRSDLSVWIEFLRYFNGVSLFREPPCSPIQIITDALKSRMGGYLGAKWIQIR